MHTLGSCIASGYCLPKGIHCRAGAINSARVVIFQNEGGGHMSYFVTGATGFIGRHLVANLLKRKGTIHVLVRRGSQKKLDALIERMAWDKKRIVPVYPDAVNALNQKTLRLQGFMMPLEPGENQRHFLLASVPRSSRRFCNSSMEGGMTKMASALWPYSLLLHCVLWIYYLQKHPKDSKPHNFLHAHCLL